MTKSLMTKDGKHLWQLCVLSQAADLFFGADALPHDYLHESLFRLLAIGYVASGTSFLVNKVNTIPYHPEKDICTNICRTGTWVAVQHKVCC